MNIWCFEQVEPKYQDKSEGAVEFLLTVILVPTVQPVRPFLKKTWPIKQTVRCSDISFHRLSALCVNLFSFCILQYGPSGKISNLIVIGENASAE